MCSALDGSNWLFHNIGNDEVSYGSDVTTISAKEIKEAPEYDLFPLSEEATLVVITSSGEEVDFEITNEGVEFPSVMKSKKDACGGYLVHTFIFKEFDKYKIRIGPADEKVFLLFADPKTYKQE